MTERQRRHVRITRDLTSYLLGVGGFVYSIVVLRGESIAALTASCALLGFPLVARADERRRERE